MIARVNDPLDAKMVAPTNTHRIKGTGQDSPVHDAKHKRQARGDQEQKHTELDAVQRLFK